MTARSIQIQIHSRKKFKFRSRFACATPQISQETDKITLNSVDLKIQKAAVKLDDGTVVDSIETIYVPESEVVNLLFSKPLPVSQTATLSMQFTGELNDKMKGFYRSKYFTSTGEERFAGVTQFEATDARRCFPCWVSEHFF